MPLTIFALVLFSALLHATWNAFAKNASGDKLLTMSVFALCSGLVSIPFIPFFGLPHPDAWIYLLVSGFVHIAYYILVGLCYRHGDFSVVYPIFRGSAPLLTLFVTSLILREMPLYSQIIGVLVIVSGLLLLSSNAIYKGGLTKKAVIYVLLLAVVVASYTVIDGLGARASQNPISYSLFNHIFNGSFMVIVSLTFLKIDYRKASHEQWKAGVYGGILSMIAYGIVLYAMTKTNIALVSAVRETSVLFATLIGWWFLKEKLGKNHIFSAILIVAGLALIKL